MNYLLSGRLWSIGRAAFRTVILKGKQQGILEVFQAIPVLKDIPIPALHRLCLGCKEYQFDKGEVIVSEATLLDNTWCFGIIITGIIRLIAKEEGKKRQLRSELSYFSIEEIGSKFYEARADCKLRMICIPQPIYNEILGVNGVNDLKEAMLKPKVKGKRLPPLASIFTQSEENHSLTKFSSTYNDGSGGSSVRFQFDQPVAVLGDFGYIGIFRDCELDKYCCVKVIAKSKATSAHMDVKLLQERNLLAAMCNACPYLFFNQHATWLPTLTATMQTEKLVYLFYKDSYRCDLELAILNNAIADGDKPYYMACLYSAMQVIHELGLIHRFINPESIYITAEGVPKVRSNCNTVV